jgi:hypothetical protein
VTAAFWDRVTGERVRELAARPLLGRYDLDVPAVLNGRSAAARTPVLPTASGHWSVSRPGGSEAGYFGRSAFPSRELARHTIAIAGALSEAAADPDGAGRPPYERWAETPPVATDLIALLRGLAKDDSALALEQSIDRDLPHLEAVCRRPETRLRRQSVVMPLSRSRRPAPDAVSYLAAHTEDWQQRTVWGVYPQRLRSIRNEADSDLYENRAAVKLIDNLLSFLDWRREKLRGVTDFFEDVEKLTTALENRPWRSQRRLSFLLHEVADYTGLHISALDLYQRTLERRNRVERLRAAPLYQDRRVSRNVEFSAELRRTNLLAYHEDYRRVDALWRAWARASRAAGLSDVIELRHYCASFSAFVALLIARSLETLGYRATTTHVPVPGGPGLEYVGPDGSTLTVHWAADSTVEVRRTAVLLVTFTPLPHPLTTDPQAPELRAFADELDKRGSEASLRVVAYPGTHGEQGALPAPLRRRANTVGNDLVGGSAIGLIAVTPTELDSIERVIRVLQWALIAPDAAAYPPRVSLPPDLPGDLLAACGSWLTRSGGQVTLKRPPESAEWDQLHELIAGWRVQYLPPARRRDRESAAGVFVREIEAARVLLRRLACCPVCRTEASPRDFRARPGTFQATCNACKNDWETRTCSFCKYSYPVIHIRRGTARESTQETTSQLGNEVLALPCWDASASAYICPQCGRCGEHAAPAAKECQRCAGLHTAQQTRRRL